MQDFESFDENRTNNLPQALEYCSQSLGNGIKASIFLDLGYSHGMVDAEIRSLCTVPVQYGENLREDGMAIYELRSRLNRVEVHSINERQN